MTSDQIPGPQFIERRRAFSSLPYSTLRTRWLTLLLVLLLCTVLGFLLLHNHRNLIALQATRMEHLLFDLNQKAKMIAYFIAERENDLRELAAVNNVASGFLTNVKLGMTEEYGLKGSRALVRKKLAEMNNTALLDGNETYSRLALFSAEGKVVVDLKESLTLAEQWSDTLVLPKNHQDDFQIKLIGGDRQYLRLIASIGNPTHCDGYIVGWIALDALYNTFFGSTRLDRQYSKTSRDYYVLRVNENFAMFADGQREKSDKLSVKLSSGGELVIPAIGNTQPGWAKVESDFFGNLKTALFYSYHQRNVTFQVVHWLSYESATEVVSPLFVTFLLALLCAIVLGFSFMTYHFILNSKFVNIKMEDALQRQREVLAINTMLQEEVQSREAAESRLKEEKSFLQSLIAAIPDQIYFKDNASKHLGHNDTFEQFWKSKSFEIAGKDNFSNGVWIDESLQINDSEVLLEGSCIQYSHWVVNAAGCRVFLDTKKSPIYSSDGEIAGLISISRDRTTEILNEVENEKQRLRLDLIFKATNAGIWDWDVQSGELFVNERWAEIVGYTLEELSPISINTWLEIAHPEDLKRGNALIDNHFKKETAFYNCEIRIRHKSGHWVWISDRGKVVQWAEDGTPLRMSGIHIDISEQKQIEQRLVESERNFRTFFETIGDMVFVCDTATRIIHSNIAAKTLLGYDDEQLKCMTILDIHGADRRHEAEEILMAMVKGERGSCPLPLVTCSGESVAVESRIWFGQWNGIDAIYGVSKDLRMEEEAQQRFERLFRNNPVPMALSFFQDAILLDINTSFLTTFGYERHEVIGNTADQLGMFVEPEKLEMLRARLMKKVSFSGFETQVKRKNGEVIDGIFSGEILKTKQGKILLTVMVNITPLKTAERELRQLNDTLEHRVEERTQFIKKMHEQMIIHDKMAAVGQLAAGVAHELNNPMNFVATNFNVLREYYTEFVEVIEKYRQCIDTEDPAMQAYLQAIEADFRLDFILQDIPNLFDESERGFQRIEKIIRSMRNFSHSEQTAEKVNFDINGAIEDTLIIAINTYKYHAIVNTDLGPLPMMLCYPELLKQVFLNLLVNSAQAIEMQKRKQMGTINIRTWLEGNDVVCEFADDGPGIPQNVQTRIFEPFFTTKPPGTGVGLGLSICYDIIVNKHQGELNVICPPKGGTAFVIRLPVSLHRAASCSADVIAAK